METKEKKTGETQGVARERKKTLTLTLEQLDELSTNPELCKQIVAIVNGSEGNMKGNMAFEIAKAMQKQQKLKI